MKAQVMEMHVLGGDGNGEPRLVADRTKVIAAWLEAQLRENERLAQRIVVGHQHATETLVVFGAASPEYGASYHAFLLAIAQLQDRCTQLCKEMAWKEIQP